MIFLYVFDVWICQQLLHASIYRTGQVALAPSCTSDDWYKEYWTTLMLSPWSCSNTNNDVLELCLESNKQHYDGSNQTARLAGGQVRQQQWAPTSSGLWHTQWVPLSSQLTMVCKKDIDKGATPVSLVSCHDGHCNSAVKQAAAVAHQWSKKRLVWSWCTTLIW